MVRFAPGVRVEVASGTAWGGRRRFDSADSAISANDGN
jgi:hypothetical protein